MKNHDLEKAARRVLARHENSISPYVRDFCARMYASPQEGYRKRLEKIGFSNLDTVLDAGCGFGQWSLALRTCGVRKVEACDIAPERIAVFGDILAELGEREISPVVAPLEHLPWPDGHVDAVFCYGCIHAADTQRALHEFFRILKPGGVLYATANAFGYYAQRWLENRKHTDDHHPRLSFARIFLSTVVMQDTGRKTLPWGVVIEKNEMRTMLENSGFADIRMEGEGHISLHGEPAMPFFPSEFLGLDAVYEIMAVKKGLRQ